MCSVLIVDDHLDTRDALATYLAELGHDALGAADGLEALEHLQTHRPCILLIDLRMPRMDGWELLSELKRRSDLSKIPVIILSERVVAGHPPPVLPAAAFWPKPLDIQLVDSIGAYCPLHQTVGA
jgi:CheY-like chemotaxis protein